MNYINEINSSLIHFTTQMYLLFKNYGRKVTVVATGPLTNIALLLLNHPDVLEYIEKLVLMGGSIGIGNENK
jgi:inosine-uridine nucleoside N-ribohydrolase